MRFLTGVGIAVGGTFGALAALMGEPDAPTPSRESPLAAAVAPSASLAIPVASRPASGTDGTAASALASSRNAEADALAATTEAAAATSPAVSTVANEAAVPSAARRPSPPLVLPSTLPELLKAQLFCDQRQDFDECSRAAQAFEAGTAGSADPVQAKRFRSIAITHLVKQCEKGAPHACFVLSDKLRAGTELELNPESAKALEQRATELCKHRAAPECPAAP